MEKRPGRLQHSVCDICLLSTETQSPCFQHSGGPAHIPWASPSSEESPPLLGNGKGEEAVVWLKGGRGEAAGSLLALKQTF